MKLLFYSKSIEPRVRYISKTIFENIGGYHLKFTTDENLFIQSDCLRIQYGKAKVDVPSFCIPRHSFLAESDIREQHIDVRDVFGLPAFFYCAQSGADLPFDFLSLAFYLLSRYEEYLPFDADEHDRFTATESIAHQHNFLRKPIVDQWFLYINNQLSAKFNYEWKPPRSYKYHATIDVDFAWAYLHKNTWRTLAGLSKDIATSNFKGVRNRLAVLNKTIPDPYDRFEYLKALHQSYSIDATYFFLFGKYGAYDKNTAPEHQAMRKLVQSITETFDIGIHPSYASNLDIKNLKKEKEDLSNVSQLTITKSRQHYLKLSFPKTYRNLLSIGLQSDYTMGYAGDVGFRASTSHAYYWYDLELEQMTSLKIHPFQFMDVTLKNYLNLSPEEAISLCNKIITEVRAVNGTCISIWHNSSFSSLMDWDGWKEVYAKVLELGD